MNDANIILETQAVEIAESMPNGNIRAKFVICDFGINKNKVQINRDTVISWYQSIVNQPLVGKIKNNDFTGHNLKVIPYVDEAGEIQKRIELDTDAFGTFVSSSIEKIDGVECLTATAEIWSRFPRAFKLVQERITDGTLYSSFEVRVDEYHYADGIKIVDSGAFTAHCCLGKNVVPAYDTSKLLEVAEYEDDITQALQMDIAEQRGENVEDVVKTVETVEEPKEEIVEEVTEISVEEKPEETTQAEEVDPEEKVEDVESSEEVKADVLDFEGEIKKRDEALAMANDRINQLMAEIETLKPYKEAADKAEAERIEAEKASQKAALRAYALQSNLISENELDAEPIKNLIDDIDEAGIKALIGQRFMESLSAKEEFKPEDKIAEVHTNVYYDEHPVDILKLIINK